MGVGIPDSLTSSLGRLLRPTEHDELLRSAVRLARLTFSASAASVFLYDEERDRLVFEASSGEGEDRLLGVAIPTGRGVAGWVFQTGETVLLSEVQEDPRFDREFAQSTGYVPKILMAAPLELEDRTIGVMEVLDPALQRFGEMAAIDLFTELAAQTAITLTLMAAARSLTRSAREGLTPWSRLEIALSRTEATDAAVDELLNALSKFVTATTGHGVT
ncbi:GAF domain-containing protein [Nonomuraea angiospora]|uniref:GAF domain-containing protein n=1 Tax=Nonomuraea angiospora TaxID=46172 RepID=A0ABR9MHE5_9ACTN|nr:GAF domain-containing protein [Nonomuraea angiospora]MBE1592065.1 GAF domain-containing protein [Nonomuraea angiospora]MDX3104482.1 GAF domain-containing protein [Nonomuraea angiospora]